MYGGGQKPSFHNQQNLNCYGLKIVDLTYMLFYVSLMITTKQNTIADIQIIKRKESVLRSTKNYQITQITQIDKRGRK